MQKISTFLWFDGEAEEAANFYVSVFRNAKITSISRYGEVGPRPAGTVMVVAFDLFGQTFYALNAGPEYKFTPAISLMITCETQEEVDYYWDTLSEGGEPNWCGWLQDKYGLSWQITPSIMSKLMAGPDTDATQRMMAAMMEMRKLDIAKLQAAYDGA